MPAIVGSALRMKGAEVEQHRGRNQWKRTMTSIHGQPPRITLKALLEAGVHFGHQAKRWNPKMKPISSPSETAFISSIFSRPFPYLRRRTTLSPTRLHEAARSFSSGRRTGARRR